MSLTPEQFNKLVTKEEHNELKETIEGINNKIDTIIDIVENIATDMKNFREEQVSNQAAHDRFNDNFQAIKNKKIDKIITSPSIGVL